MAEAPDPEQARTLRAVSFVHRSAGKPWFWPVVGLFPSLDYLLPVLPNQLLMIALSMLQPKKWPLVAMVFIAASALGAFGTALLIQALGEQWMRVMPFSPAGEAWKWAMEQVQRWGLFAVGLLALLPVPPRTAVLACAVAGLPAEGIAAAVAIGRTFPAIAISWLSARAPGFLVKLPVVGPRAAALLARLQTEGSQG